VQHQGEDVDHLTVGAPGATDEQLVEGVLREYGDYQDLRASQICDAAGSLLMAGM
jgi:hypothetical protein